MSMSIKNQNFFQGKDFQFVINRLPHVQYFGTRFNLPPIDAASAVVSTPFTNVKVPGDTLQYSQIDLTFKIDADLRNVEEIIKWMEAYGFPNDHGQYRSATPAFYNTANVRDKVSDIEVIFGTNKYNPNISFVFENAFPTSFGGISVNVDDTDVVVRECTVRFDYTKYHLHRKNSE